MSEYREDELKKLQYVLIEILDEVVRICDKHHLTYFLAGGTALGAIRHSGFIPWDDDVDILLPRSDYMKFLDIAKDELDDKYFLDYYKTNKYYHKHHATIRKNNTFFGTEGYEERVAKKIHQGFFIDILPLDYIPSRTSIKTHIDAALIKIVQGTLRYKRKYDVFKNLRYKFISVPLVLVPNKCLHWMLYKMGTKYDNKKRPFLIEFYAPHNYSKVIYDYDTVFPASKAIFCGKEYNVFHDVDRYLTQIYGNYMKLPPKEKRIAHKPLIMDFDKGFNYNTKEEYNKLNRK